jgi:hypothetical protein
MQQYNNKQTNNIGLYPFNVKLILWGPSAEQIIIMIAPEPADRIKSMISFLPEGDETAHSIRGGAPLSRTSGGWIRSPFDFCFKF